MIRCALWLAVALAAGPLGEAAAGGGSVAGAAPRQGAGEEWITAGPDRRVELDFEHYYRFKELESALKALAEAYPELLRLESIGQSREGRELWVASVTDLSVGDPRSKPALFLAANFGRDDLYGTELSLYVIYDLLQNVSRNTKRRELLAGVTLYVAPCLNPDAREAEFDPEGPEGPEGMGARVDVSFDRNFPVRWHPWNRGGGCGAYPLCEPETRAVAIFLEGRDNVSLVQVAGGVERSIPLEVGGRPLPAADLRIYERLDLGPNVQSSVRPADLSVPVHPGGGFLEFAYRQLGAFGVVTRVWEGSGLPPVAELRGLGRRCTEATLFLAGHLPRLVLAEPVIQRVKDDTWQVDVAVRNFGVLPTLSRAGDELYVTGPARLRTEGPRIVAAAVRRGDEGGFEVVRSRPDNLDLGQIEGGSELTVRLILEGAPSSELSLLLSSHRAGSSVVELALPAE